MSLTEGMTLGLVRLLALGLTLSPSQPSTLGDGNCFVHALLDQIQYDDRLKYFASLDISKLRKKIASSLEDNINNGRIFWVHEEGSIDKFGEGTAGLTSESWERKMSTDGEFCDHIFLQLAAITLNRDIVVVPIFSESATIDGQFSICKAAG